MVDSPHGQSTWQALQDWLSQDTKGQALLTRFLADPSSEANAMAQWLREHSTHAPSRLATYVSGGQISRLVNVAQAAVVQVQEIHHVPSTFEPYRLPRDIDDFTGRHKQLAKLTTLLERKARDSETAATILAVAGMPGVGKSALAIRAAHCVKDHFPEAQLYIDLRGDRGQSLNPNLVLELFLRALGIGEQIIPKETEERAGLYRSRLAGKRALVFLDNACDEPQVRPLLPGSPTCAVLVTSRKPLSALEGATVLKLTKMGKREALSLLRRLVGRKRVRAELKAAERIIGLCGLLPLAIRIAGGRLRDRPHWSLESYTYWLADEERRLGQLQLGDLNVRASFGLSYRDLDPDEAHAFRLLGTLAETDFSWAKAAALLNTDQRITWDILERLVDLQLLESVGESLYRLHDLVRLFARERFKQEESAEARKAAWVRLNRLSALHQLPPGIPDFTGRDEVVRRLLTLLRQDGGRAAISGIGGIGKTVLAIHVAQQLIDVYPDAQFYVDLRGTSQEPLTPEQAMSQIDRAFHPIIGLPEGPAEVAALYRSVLTGKRVLILLDDAASVEQILPLMPPSSCGVIVTSRRELTLPKLHSVRLDALTEEEAQEILLRILGQDRATKEELTTLAELCGRLPLALRLAGSSLAICPDQNVAEYIEALTNRRDQLSCLKLGAIDIGSVLGLSVAQLARDHPELVAHWQMLSVFPAPFSEGAAAAVWEVNEIEALKELELLAEWGLLSYDVEDQSYWLHDLMRMIARNASEYIDKVDQTVEQPALDKAASRHAMHFLELGEQAERIYRQGGKHVLEGLRQFDVVWPHLQAAWMRMRERDDEASARWLNSFPDRMAYTLSLYLAPRTMVHILMDAVERARRLGDLASEGSHLGNLGLAHANQGETRQAIDYLKQALGIACEIGDRSNESIWLGNLGDMYRQLGETNRAIEHFEQALETAREIGDRRNEGVWLGNLGLAYAELKAHQAIDYLEQALEIARWIGDRHNEGIWLGNLGLVYADLREIHRATYYSEKALEIAREIGDQRRETTWLSNLGLVYSSQGHWKEAVQGFEEALSISRELGDRRGEATAINNLGLVYLSQGRLDEALQTFQKALTVFQQVEDRQSAGKAHMNLGNVYLRLARWNEAVQEFQRALAVLRELGDRSNEGTTLMNLGNVYFRLGSWNEAIQIFRKALSISRELGNRADEGRVLNNLALTYADQGHSEKAIHMFEEALAIARSLGDRQGEGQALMNMGLLYKEQGLSEAAMTLWRTALPKLHPDSPEHRSIATWLQSVSPTPS